MNELTSDFSSELKHFFSLRKSVDSIVMKYLVSLMEASITCSQKIYLSDLYSDAIEAGSKRERISKFKELGDYSLFISGYFPESISNNNYYKDMGAAAYYQVYTLGSERKPFYELATRYADCVAALNHVSSVQKLYGFESIGDMYITYLETQSPILKKKLFRFGVFSSGEATG